MTLRSVQTNYKSIKRRYGIQLLVLSGVFSFAACDTPSERAKKLPATPYKKAIDKAEKLKKKVKKYADKIEKLAK